MHLEKKEWGVLYLREQTSSGQPEHQTLGNIVLLQQADDYGRRSPLSLRYLYLMSLCHLVLFGLVFPSFFVFSFLSVYHNFFYLAYSMPPSCKPSESENIVNTCVQNTELMMPVLRANYYWDHVRHFERKEWRFQKIIIFRMSAYNTLVLLFSME